MDNQDWMLGFLLGMFVMGALNLALGFFIDKDVYRLQQEAISAGVAEWVLVSEPGPDAEFEFKWIKP